MRSRPRPRVRALLGALAAAAVWPAGSARAEPTFEQAAAGATRVARLDDLVWALAAPCDRGDDVQDRQCRLLRDRKAKALAGTTVLVEAEPEAFTAGAWSPQKKSVPVSLTGCVRCAGLEIDGRAWYVTAGGPPREGAGKLLAASLHDSARPFPDEAAAAAWTKTLAPVRVQLVLKVPARPRWQVAGKDGIALDLVAYRVVTPCKGAVVIAQPASGPAEADPKACPAAARP